MVSDIFCRDAQPVTTEAAATEAAANEPANDGTNPRENNPGIGIGARHCAACLGELGRDYRSLGDGAWVHPACHQDWIAILKSPDFGN